MPRIEGVTRKASKREEQRVKSTIKGYAVFLLLLICLCLGCDTTFIAVDVTRNMRDVRSTLPRFNGQTRPTQTRYKSYLSP